MGKLIRNAAIVATAAVGLTYGVKEYNSASVMGGGQAQVSTDQNNCTGYLDGYKALATDTLEATVFTGADNCARLYDYDGGIETRDIMMPTQQFLIAGEHFVAKCVGEDKGDHLVGITEVGSGATSGGIKYIATTASAYKQIVSLGIMSCTNLTPSGKILGP